MAMVTLTLTLTPILNSTSLAILWSTYVHFYTSTQEEAEFYTRLD